MTGGPAMPDIAGAEFLARPGVRQVLGLLDGGGEEARVVGGAVRNHLMDLPIADIDIATTAVPDEVLRRAREAGVHAVPTGYEHGTVTLVAHGVAHEVTTLREDIHTDGRHAVVCFGRDFAADALRRDFTINALSVDGQGRLFDYGGGLADVAARRVRFIGGADQRIREDYLRILRFFRFSAAYGDGTLEPGGLAAVLRHREGLSRLSRERIRQEMMKLIVAPQAGPVIGLMAEHGLLAPVLEGPGDAGRFLRLVALEAEAGARPEAVRRLMALAVSAVADLDRLREALRLTNEEMRRMTALVAARPDQHAHLALYRLGAEAFRDAVLLSAAAGDWPEWREVMALPEAWQPPPFLLSGKDVLARGVARGPEVGETLARAERQWIAAGFPAAEDAQQQILAGALPRPA